MKFQLTMIAVGLAVAGPTAFAQQYPDMPVSPIVSTADMMGAPGTGSATDEQQLDEYGLPVSHEDHAANDNGQPNGSEMPIAPVGVLSKNVPSAKPLATGQKVHDVKKISEQGDEAKYNTKPIEVTTQFGQTELVNVAMGHPTRIVTPFMKPSVLKIDEDAIVSVKQNVIYFASDKRTPVTLHVREEGYEAQSITLTLLPQKIPPREVLVKIPGREMADANMFAGRNETAEKWEQSNPYEQTLVQMLTTIAKGELPTGYRMRDFLPSDEAPLCQQRGLRFVFEEGQVLTGNDFTVYIGVVRNMADQAIEFVETNCASREVASVSAWPDVYLAPGQETEVFVVDKDQPRESNTRRRRSLIGGGQ
ncbi:TraK domain-containing protein [Marinobacter salicampi]|uniref:TraK domain-containing protein n=1 Tax=Marinobacter salicampi TaxID=435907 RepID=UPI001407D420|nr:type-F conjugative transfer system secretin TraK [Marinobacter salicampi]